MLPPASTISSASSASEPSGLRTLSTRREAACWAPVVPVPPRSSSTESTLPQPSMLPSIPVVSEWVSDLHRSLSSMP